MKTVGKNDSGRLLQCFSQFRQQMTIHSFIQLSCKFKTENKKKKPDSVIRNDTTDNDEQWAAPYE